MQEKKVIEWAPSLQDAIALTDMYIKIARALELDDWLFGYEKDPQSFAGHHGYSIYAVSTVPEQRKPPDAR